MTLPAKYRFKETELPKRVSVSLTIEKEPSKVKYRHPTWPHEKDLVVMGRSNDSDLMGAEIPVDELADLVSAAQYILSDEEMNIYEGVIHVVETKNGTIGYMTAIKTKPHK